MRDPRKAQRRLSRNTVASPSAIHMWSPTNGEHPQKTPTATDQPTSRGVECSRRARRQSSRVRCQKRVRSGGNVHNVAGNWPLGRRAW
jgi:hypothetical protein